MCSSSASKGENVFFAEFLPRVGVYQISFATRRNCRLTVCPRGVVYTELRHSGTEEGEEIFTWPPHLPDLDPGSFLDPHKLASGTSIPPLQLRFRCIRTCHTVRADFEKILDPPDLAPVLRSTAFAVKCGFCGNRLTRPGYQFKRILPLPSEEWLEIAGDAFCHPHTSHSHTPHTPHTLTPREGDCLTSERVIRVMGECVRAGAMTTKQGAIYCTRCYLILGKPMTNRSPDSNWAESPVKEGAESLAGDVVELTAREGAECQDVDMASLPLELLRCRISFKLTTTPSPPLSHPPPSFPSPHSPPLSPFPSLPSLLDGGAREREQFLSHTLSSAAKEKSSFKFNIQDSHRHDVHLYVWMLNVSSHVIHSSDHVTHNPDHVTSNLQLSSKFTGHFPVESCSYTALKLLYVVATETDHAPWSRDQAEPLPLTLEECLWMCVLLCDSTLRLPPAQRTGRGPWKVGYLCLK